MPEIRRKRSRTQFNVDSTDIVDRVLHFFDIDDGARATEKELRIQRYAKFRMWTEGRDWPWPDASDVPFSDMMEKSLRVQDTIHNAVMSARPVIGANANNRADKDKERSIDKLIDNQVFVEQDGEDTVGDLADAFVNDGVAIVFLPWVKELRPTSDVGVFKPIPPDALPIDYFKALLSREFGQADLTPTDEQGWNWRVTDGDRVIDVKFYTGSNGGVQMVKREETVVYDGPRIIQKEWDEVIYPARAANLQPPGPSNPKGAAHVILVDYPTVDEVLKLAKAGIYDLLDKENLTALENTANDRSANQEFRNQKDDLQGVDGESEADRKKAPGHRTVTRLLCFDVMDVGNGKTEDVVWWVIKDIKALVRRELMTEVFPSSPPRRPLRSQAFLPIRGRVAGISLLEMMEGLHDIMKTVLDQTIDSGTLANAPFGFYRPSGSLKPEIINMEPGQLYPLQDPKRDVDFPNFPSRDQTFGFNLLSLLDTKEEKLTTVGDLQQGRVPKGGSSALRTVGGMALIAAQGEARPERILRRFFSLLKEIWSDIHGLNRNFLPETKKIRVIGIQEPGEDPYIEIKRGDVSGSFSFNFSANVLNTSKAALQESIGALMAASINEFPIQAGIINVEGAYRLFREFYIAHGQDPDRFINAPSAEARQPRIFAEEAVVQILSNSIPSGAPAEVGGAQEHLQKLSEIINSDEIGILNDSQQKVLATYIEQVMQKAAAEAQQAALAQSAGAFGQNGGEPGRPPQGAPGDAAAPLQDGELADETLPGAGGGANQ